MASSGTPKGFSCKARFEQKQQERTRDGVTVWLADAKPPKRSDWSPNDATFEPMEEPWHDPLGFLLVSFNRLEMMLERCLVHAMDLDEPRSLMFGATLAQIQSVDGRARLLLQLTGLRFAGQPRTIKRAIRLRAAIRSANTFRNLVIHGQWRTFAGLYDIDHSGVHTPIGYQANISRFNHRRDEPILDRISLNQAFLQKRANQVWVLSRLLAKFAHFLQAENAKAPAP